MSINQQPNKISDFDLMTELDVCCKHEAAQLTSAILESSNQQIRQQLTQALQQTLQQQQQLAQLMMQKGYYRPLPSSQQMIQTAREQMEMANAQVGGPFPPGITQGAQANITGAISPQIR
ncbi:MAG: spore coat protein [Bacillota bacterium]